MRNANYLCYSADECDLCHDMKRLGPRATQGEDHLSPGPGGSVAGPSAIHGGGPGQTEADCPGVGLVDLVLSVLAIETRNGGRSPC